MILIGIDPGKKGGLASIKLRDIEVVSVNASPMLATEREISGWFEALTEFDYCKAVIEKVSSSPQMGVVSAFTFGRGYGTLQGILTSLKIPYDEVRPQVWQKELGCMTKGDKNITKSLAQKLFPHIKVTHKIADALLIAEYLRRREIREGR